ncbi:CD8A protein, partial [Urocolius indicus]|nr:CD8A protein [Urocolius indicus]
MAGSAALLLLLSLGLCCPGIRGQTYTVRAGFRYENFKHLQVGQRLELECVTDTADSGVFWIHQDKAGTLHFVVFISYFSRVTFERSKRTSTRFEARKDKAVYWLAVKSFSPRDQGNYFCLTINNQAMYFSSRLTAFLP